MSGDEIALMLMLIAFLIFLIRMALARKITLRVFGFGKLKIVG